MALRPDREPGRQAADAERIRNLADTAGDGRLPDADEHDQLLKAAARGDQLARELLTKVHLPWVVRAAEERADRGLSQNDLFQEGTIGLMHAIATFRDSGATDFEVFAMREVARHMDHALSEEERTVQNGEMLVQAARDYEQAEISVRQELGREGTDAELAQKLGWPLERIIGIGELVAEARRRYDEEMLQYLEPDAVDAIIELDLTEERGPERQGGDGG